MRHVPVEYRMTLSTLGFIEVELRCCMVINVNLLVFLRNLGT